MSPGQPIRPRSSDDEWAKFLYFRSNPKGVAAERWRHAFGCGRFFNCLRDTASDRILAVYKPGEARPDLAADGPGGADELSPFAPTASVRSTARAPWRSRSMASLTKATPAIRWPPRCSPTAFIWLGARSSITARAESWPPGPRSRTRWSASRAGLAGSRPTCVRRRSSSTMDSMRRARIAGRRSHSTSARSTTCCRLCSAPASITRRSWARTCSARTGPGRMSMSRRSAAPRDSAPRRARRIPTAISGRSRIATS